MYIRGGNHSTQTLNHSRFLTHLQWGTTRGARVLSPARSATLPYKFPQKVIGAEYCRYARS
jgi:hypothetical protein